MKRFISVILLLALMLSLAACSVEVLPDTPEPDPTEEVQDYGTVYAAIKAAQKQSGEPRAFNGLFATDKAATEVMEAETIEPQAAKAAADYSGTNVQVEGIDEADVVKTDGEYIYALFFGELRIYKADGANTTRVSTVKLLDENASYDPNEMYIYGDRLIVVASEYQIFGDMAINSGFKTVNTSTPRTKLLVYDVSDPAAPNYVNCYAQDGSIRSSRLYGGRLYLITSYYVGGDIRESEPATFVPRTYCNEEPELVPADSICILPDCDSACYTVVTCYGLDDGTTENISVLGQSDTVYMSKNSLFLASSEYKEEVSEERTEDIYTVTDHRNYRETELCRIDLATMRAAGNATVPGYLESQFSLDEYNGYLRAVTTSNDERFTVYYDKKHDFQNWKWDEDSNSSSTGLYVLDGNMNSVAKIEGLAEDEYVRSVRFDGDFVYFCTFRQTDPLFAVNLEDPAKPEILSEYKISGFSEYLHPWSEGLLFGLGYEADIETGGTEGLKLVMFDISDKRDVKAKHTENLDEDHSNALYDHKALLISPEKGMIGFEADNSFVIYGYNEAEGFKKLADIGMGDDWWYNSRGLYIGEYIYVVSDNDVTVLDLNSFEMMTVVS